ncbi:MAG: hypothetical protein KTU85_04685 [Acidimicrobiia bacterium]|nr:hypothetical protein [Acidimicrobiia bacterium]MCY4456383.1 hypothetical protein [Acidimicrobiaceae bacterium]
MAVLGADVEQLDQLGRKFDEEAQKIDATISTITAQVQQAWWKGTDAERFRNDWEGTGTAQLRQVIQRLQAASNDCRKQAQEQRQVSQS